MSGRRMLQASKRADDSRLKSQALSFLNQAWELYYVVFRKINKHLGQVMSYGCIDGM